MRSNLEQPRFGDLPLSECGGAPVLRSLWDKFDFSFLLSQSGISKRSGAPAWMLCFLYVMGLTSGCTAVSQMASLAAKDAVLREMFKPFKLAQYTLSRLFTTPFAWRTFGKKRVERLQQDEETKLRDGDVVNLDDTHSNHPFAKRMPFLCWLKDASTKAYSWCMNLVVLQAVIKLPYDNRDFSARNNAISDAKTKRKEETSAITPLLPEIRAEAHMRFNQVERLQQAFNTVLTSSIANNSEFPVEFHYDESEFVNERWYFFIHDVRRVLSSVPADQRYVLEFIKAENLSDGSAGEGPWFVDLLKLKLLGNWSTPYLTPEHRENIMNYLHHWGYETEGSEKIPSPFNPRNIGLLIQGFYVSKASTIENKTFINIQPIYMACLFAKFALDIITSSGARMNELLQISYDKDCCVITIDRAQSPPKKNFILRLTPKGREEPENYYVPEEIFKSIHEIVKVLKEHYKSDHLPEVEYSVSSRHNILNDKRRFVFQINGKHINVFSINAIIRFLLHGVLMETSSGKQVTMKSHLLRHAFATHAVQTEKIPLDIVRVLLHQKDIEVTSYYAAPTNGQLSEAVESMNNSMVSVLDIQKGIIRAPGELQEMYQEYKDKVGTLSKVTGGICMIDSVCPTRMACVGCGAKVPQPSFKDELQEYYNWASESQLKFEKLGLPLEAQKMKITKTRAKNELKEIELLERTIKDKNHEADIRINQTGKNLA